VHNCLASAQPKSCKKRLPFGRCAPYAPPLRVGLSRPLAAQKWLAYGQAIYQGADKPRRRHSTAGAEVCLVKKVLLTHTRQWQQRCANY
jgi:hypothetical protein